MSQKVNVGLRLEAGILPQLEALARLMTVRTGGAHVSQAEAARTALKRGLAILLDEMKEVQPASKP